MRSPEGPPRDERTVALAAGAVDLRDLDALLHRKWRKYSRHPVREHGLARTRRPAQNNQRSKCNARSPAVRSRPAVRRRGITSRGGANLGATKANSPVGTKRIRTRALLLGGVRCRGEPYCSRPRSRDILAGCRAHYSTSCKRTSENAPSR